MESKKMILVVEDEQALQEALELKLKKAGFEVLTANSGEEALEVLKNKKPDLISLDILLPHMNGLEVLQKIRNDKELQDLRVAVVSVSGSQEKIKKTFGLNVVDYLIKSEYTIDEIVGKLKELTYP